MHSRTDKKIRALCGLGIAIFSAALILSSCSKKPEQALIGKWNVQEGKSAAVEFRKDGTLVSTENDKVTYGKFSFTDRTHMQIQVFEHDNTNQPLTITAQVAISGDSADLILTGPGTDATNVPPHTAHLIRAK